MRDPATAEELAAAAREVAEAAVAMYEAERVSAAAWYGDNTAAKAHGAALRRFHAAVHEYAAIRPRKDPA